MKNKIVTALSTLGKAFLFCLSLAVLQVIFLRFIPVSYSPLMLIRAVQFAGDEDYQGVQHDWVSLEEIPNHMQLAVVCTEDQRFVTHHGFDFEAIKDAFEDAEEGKRVRGGSTISQQTAKNVFLWPSSTWVRKGFEAGYTLLIETFWSKERIMEVYLNTIEFGKGVYGVEAASNHFFRKSASRLSTLEAARLAVVLPNPIKYKANASGGYVVRRQAYALGQMRNFGGALIYHPEIKEQKKSTRKKSKV
jgi:monofunctional biosynthetic peptidoglycan transglycosylase